MNIKLAPDLDAFLAEVVRGGKYASPEAAVADAVFLLRQYYEKIEWLRREPQASIDQYERGDFSEWEAREVRGRIMALYGRETPELHPKRPQKRQRQMHRAGDPAEARSEHVGCASAHHQTGKR